MKILVFQKDFRIFAGGEKVIAFVIEKLAESGAEVFLITNELNPKRWEEYMGKPLSDRVIVINYSYKRIRRPGFFSAYLNLIRSAFFLTNLRKKVGSLDLLLSNNYEMPWLIAPLFPLARKNAFLIHVIIGRIEQHRRLIKRLYYMISIKMIKLGLHKIDLFVNCSRFTLETLVKNLGINPSKAVVVHPFLSWPYSIRGDSSSNLRSRPKRAVYLARIAPEKRHEVLKSLATQLPEYEFISAGLYQPIHYTYFEHLVNQLPSNYKVFLNLPPLEIKKLLENCRIYLHPAVNEPFALSIQEAISSGCIPLAHNSGGHLEYIPRELRWDSIKEAKDKIIRYMEEEFAVEDYEKRIYPQLLERLCEFTPESYWEKFSSIISELLGVDTHLGGH